MRKVVSNWAYLRDIVNFCCCKYYLIKNNRYHSHHQGHMAGHYGSSGYPSLLSDVCHSASRYIICIWICAQWFILCYHIYQMKMMRPLMVESEWILCMCKLCICNVLVNMREQLYALLFMLIVFAQSVYYSLFFTGPIWKDEVCHWA